MKPIIFKSMRDGTNLTEENAVIEGLIPSQMASEKRFYETKDRVTSSRDSMDFGILITLGAQLFFSVSMHLIWGILNALQLVTNLKRMERIQTPGTVLLLLEMIDSTVNLKIHEQPQVKAAM